MTIENTDPTQQTNSGADGTATDATPKGDTGTVPGQSEGQDGGNNAAAAEDGKTGDGQAEVPEGAPEAYETFTLPEGYTLDGERLEQTQALFKELGLPQDKAQKLIDRYCQVDTENTTNLTAATEAARAQQRETWAAEAKAELGDQYQPTVDRAYLAVQAIGNPKLTAAFNDLGWGNHPELIKAFAHFGGLLKESPMDTGGQGGGEAKPKTLADRMYPKT